MGQFIGSWNPNCLTKLHSWKFIHQYSSCVIQSIFTDQRYRVTLVYKRSRKKNSSICRPYLLKKTVLNLSCNDYNKGILWIFMKHDEKCDESRFFASGNFKNCKKSAVRNAICCTIFYKLFVRSMTNKSKVNSWKCWNKFCCTKQFFKNYYQTEFILISSLVFATCNSY